MINIEPRDYQKAILETAKSSNTLAVLPTGLGKTLIALMLTIERLKEFRPSKALILAPTRPLVEQHKETFVKILPPLFGEISLFTGEVPSKERKKIWRESDIIFSTPQCIANDISKQIYDLNEVSLLVIDEAHRCLKNYDYTKVAENYKRNAKNPRILGLTASPGADYDTVMKICENLSIEEIEIRSRESEDVRPYLQNLDFLKKEIKFPAEFVEIRALLRALYEKNVQELKSKNLLFGPANKITLLKLQTNLARQAQGGNGAAMYGMSLTAQAIKVAHAIELLETQTLSGLRKYLQDLINQAEEKRSRGVQRLVKSPEFNSAFVLLTHLIGAKKEHPKIEELKKIIEQDLKNRPESKILIFTQFRETAARIVENLSNIEGARPSMFIGQAKKEEGGMSQKEQGLAVSKFKTGEINILCATSIGEEGLDIPEVSQVIFYEPIPSAIRKIQRAGRTARNMPGKLLILVTENTRDEINHYASSAREKKMYKTIEQVKTDLRKKEGLNKYL